MDLLTVEIENFLTIGSAELNLKNKGLVLIQGDNQDDPSATSNGAGKSSVPDALCWCLYGETARGVKGDAVVNRTSKKNTRVEAFIEDGDDDEYVVTRYRKHKEFKNRLTVNHNGNDITKGTDKLTQELVVQIIGCSLEVFRAAVYAGQESMPDLPGMTDKQLKVLVEEAAGIDRLQGAHVVALTKHREARVKLDLKVERLSGRKSKLVDLDESYDRLEARKDEADTTNAKLIENYRDEARLQIVKAKELTKELTTLNESSLRESLEAVVKEIDGVKSENEELESLGKVSSKSEIEAGKTDSAKSLSHMASLRCLADLESIDDKVGEPCGECGKEHTKEDLGELRKIAKVKLALASDDHKVKAKLDELSQRAAESASTVMELFKASMTDISSAVVRQSALQTSIDYVETTKTAIATCKDKAKVAIANMESAKTTENPYETLMNENRENRKDVEEAIEILVDDLKELGKQTELTGAAVEVFGQKGVRAHILDSVTPFLNERTAHYLGTLSDGNITAVWSTLTTTTKGEIREKFNIEVESSTGADNFIGLSGGEKRKVRLASAMALQDMVASRATKPINLFIADEVDHALDDAGLERLMGLLDEKARERGTVLVISHNELSDWIRDQATVTKKDGFATVTGALT
ncbi:MAG: AAA family ATPase [Piscirickettsiaceae bacterium]|nr:AAA family ATPase [Piscirickettsiaceae bacterium]